MRSRSLVLLGTLSLALACRGGGTEPDGPVTIDALVGTYDLRLVNGHALPVRQAGSTNPTDDIISGRMKLEASGFMREVSTHQLTWPNDVVYAGGHADGTFAIAGNVITVTRKDDKVTGTATLSGKTITLMRADSTYIYERADSDVAVLYRAH
jgi:hypothetical protein